MPARMPSNTAMAALRVAVALTCVGAAAQMLLYGGPVFSWLWLNLDWSEAAAVRVEHAAAFGLLACVPFAFWGKAWPVLKLVAAWLLFGAFASTMVEPWYPWLTPGAHAARYTAPLALAALSLPPAPRNRRLAEWLLRGGIAATFLCHGIEALLLRAQFIDYLIGASAKLLSRDLSEVSANAMLISIGLLDIAAALLILLPRRLWPVAAWMACWGAVTAAARMVYFGWGAWPELLIRVTNTALPLTLLLLWVEAQRAAPTKDGRETTE